MFSNEQLTFIRMAVNKLQPSYLIIVHLLLIAQYYSVRLQEFTWKIRLRWFHNFRGTGCDDCPTGCVESNQLEN